MFSVCFYCIPVILAIFFFNIVRYGGGLDSNKLSSTHHCIWKYSVPNQEKDSCYQIVRFYVCWRLLLLHFIVSVVSLFCPYTCYSWCFSSGFHLKPGFGFYQTIYYFLQAVYYCCFNFCTTCFNQWFKFPFLCFLKGFGLRYYLVLCI